MALKLVKNNIPGFIKGVTRLTSLEVLVGVPDSKGKRQSGKISNAALAYIHNYGAPVSNIPPRPFLELGVAEAKDKIKAEMKKASEQAVNGNVENVLISLNRVGLIAQSAIRKKITDGPFTPLKPATLAARRRRGRSGTKPLIDTGQLRNSISYVIRKKS